MRSILRKSTTAVEALDAPAAATGVLTGSSSISAKYSYIARVDGATQVASSPRQEGRGGKVSEASQPVNMRESI